LPGAKSVIEISPLTKFKLHPTRSFHLKVKNFGTGNSIKKTFSIFRKSQRRGNTILGVGTTYPELNQNTIPFNLFVQHRFFHGCLIENCAEKCCCPLSSSSPVLVYKQTGRFLFGLHQIIRSASFPFSFLFKFKYFAFGLDLVLENLKDLCR